MFWEVAMTVSNNPANALYDPATSDSLMKHIYLFIKYIRVGASDLMHNRQVLCHWVTQNHHHPFLFNLYFKTRPWTCLVAHGSLELVTLIPCSHHPCKQLSLQISTTMLRVAYFFLFLFLVGYLSASLVLILGPDDSLFWLGIEAVLFRARCLMMSWPPASYMPIEPLHICFQVFAALGASNTFIFQAP